MVKGLDMPWGIAIIIFIAVKIRVLGMSVIVFWVSDAGQFLCCSLQGEGLFVKSSRAGAAAAWKRKVFWGPEPGPGSAASAPSADVNTVLISNTLAFGQA